MPESYSAKLASEAKNARNLLPNILNASTLNIKIQRTSPKRSSKTSEKSKGWLAKTMAHGLLLTLEISENSIEVELNDSDCTNPN